MEPQTLVKFPQDTPDLSCPPVLSAIPSPHKLTERFRGQRNATTHEFPFIVKIITEKLPKILPEVYSAEIGHCAGSLLTNRHVLSHAYCIRRDRRKEPPSKTPPPPEWPEKEDFNVWYKLKYIIAGGAHLSKQKEDLQHRYRNQVYSVYFNHRREEFGSTEWPFLAIYVMKGRSRFQLINGKVMPTCLFIGDIRVLTDRDVMLMGWGKHGYVEPKAESVLRVLWAKMIEQNSFRSEVYWGYKHNYEQLESNTMGQFGVGQLTGGICGGDYGSPIMMPMRPAGSFTKLAWVQIGVADSVFTKGEKCTGFMDKYVYGEKKLLPVIGIHHSFNYWRQSLEVRHNAFIWMQEVLGMTADTLLGGPNPNNVEFFQWQDYVFDTDDGKLPNVKSEDHKWK